MMHQGRGFPNNAAAAAAAVNMRRMNQQHMPNAGKNKFIIFIKNSTYSLKCNYKLIIFIKMGNNEYDFLGAMMQPQHQIFMQQHGNQQRMPAQFGHMNQAQSPVPPPPIQQQQPPPPPQRQSSNVHTTPDKMAMNPDWRHTAIMTQQQSINFNDNGNLEFLDNLPVGDTSNYTAQDLLSSLDNENFNFSDILH